MRETATDQPLTEITVLIPEDRIAGFYALVAEWLRSDGSLRSHRGGEKARAGRRRNTTSKYAPLGEHLAHTEADTLTLSFDAIEDILNTDLPGSSRKHRAWWANAASHSQAAAWMEQGWLVSEARLDDGEITFKRA